jgi:uncharacterized membrane protein YkvA (DUF1232 family)
MDSRTPVITKLIIAIISVIYIVSPIDILPEILPLLGIVDDTMIIPLMMWIMIPNNILDDARKYVTAHTKKQKYHWILWSGFIAISIIIITVIYLFLK